MSGVSGVELSIFRKMKGVGLAFVPVFALMAPLPAAALTCIASEQCRGDAKAMCAPSTLQIEVAARGPDGAHLWIDWQGPYAAQAVDGGWRLEAFPDHVLRIDAAGGFLYTGNRGKRFTGRCG